RVLGRRLITLGHIALLEGIAAVRCFHTGQTVAGPSLGSCRGWDLFAATGPFGTWARRLFGSKLQGPQRNLQTAIQRGADTPLLLIDIGRLVIFLYEWHKLVRRFGPKRLNQDLAREPESRSCIRSR